MEALMEQPVGFDEDYGVVSAEQAKEAAESNCWKAGWYRIQVEKHSIVKDEEKKDRRVYRDNVDTGETRPNPFLGFRLIKATFNVYTGGEKPRKSTTNLSPDKVLVEGKVQMPYILGGQIATATATVGRSFKETMDAGMAAELYGRFSLSNGNNYLNEITAKKPGKLEGE